MISFTPIITLGLLAIVRNAIALGPSPVVLGSAGNFAILAQAGVSTVPSSSITGDIGLSPAAASFLTGFALIQVISPTFSTSTQVIGSLFAADYTSPTPSMLTTAVSNMQTAYTDASTRLNPDSTNLASGILSGLTLSPGFYQWSTGVSIPTDVTVSGSSADTWIFQIAGTFTMDPNTRVLLSGGALPQNIVWVVADAVTFGAGAHCEGIVLGATGVTLDTGSSINGRILAQTAVALQKAVVVQPST